MTEREMKNYEERLPMIDAAIDELKGEFPPTAIGYSGRGYYAKGDMANILHKINFGDVCTREEFEHRKAELQNKPSWDDAPEWANWLSQDANGSWYWWERKPELSFKAFDDDEGLYFRCSKGGKVIGNWQDTLEQRPKQEEQDMNDWYEKGGLPPVGEICKLVSQGMTLCGFDVEITYIGDEVGCYKRLKDSKEFTFASGEVVFRPLPTETDKMVDAVEQILDGCENVSNRAIAHAITNAGYRKIKQQSEQEFMKQCVDICGHGDARLYRAGCRFIEQVKV